MLDYITIATWFKSWFYAIPILPISRQAVRHLGKISTSMGTNLEGALYIYIWNVTAIPWVIGFSWGKKSKPLIMIKVTVMTAIQWIEPRYIGLRCYRPNLYIAVARYGNLNSKTPVIRYKGEHWPDVMETYDRPCAQGSKVYDILSYCKNVPAQIIGDDIPRRAVTVGH